MPEVEDTNEQTEAMVEPSTVVKHLDDKIKGMARWLSSGDPFLREDLVSQMYLEVLEFFAECNADGSCKHEQSQKIGLCLCVAKRRGIDYVNSKKNHSSYKDRVTHVSIDSMRSAGFQFDSGGMVYLPSKLSATRIPNVVCKRLNIELEVLNEEKRT